jgi:dihydroneopterin triphosphate aldolase (PTPS-III) / 6-pyruvoyltetrahydropterin synthase
MSSSSSPSSDRKAFELFLSKEDFKFSAAHFVAHGVRGRDGAGGRGGVGCSEAAHDVTRRTALIRTPLTPPPPPPNTPFSQATRERLHGHNYRVSVWMRGVLGDDGCVVDFGEVKAAVRAVCRSLDERFLCPARSPTVTVTLTSAGAGGKGGAVGSGAGVEGGLEARVGAGEGQGQGQGQVELLASDGSRFSLPAGDCLLLPLANTTVEELSVYVAERIVESVGRRRLSERRVESLTVGVMESPGQEARYTVALATDKGEVG